MTSGRLPVSPCGFGNSPGHKPHDYRVTGEWPEAGPHRHCPGGPPPRVEPASGPAEPTEAEVEHLDAVILSVMRVVVREKLTHEQIASRFGDAVRRNGYRRAVKS